MPEQPLPTVVLVKVDGIGPGLQVRTGRATSPTTYARSLRKYRANQR